MMVSSAAPLFKLIPGSLSIEQLRLLSCQSATLALEEGWQQPVQAGRRLVEQAIAEQKTVYGINTGFGLLASKPISATALESLQQNLLRSHAAGVGAPFPDEIVRLILLLKINSLARGYSGVRPVILERLIDFYNHAVYPHIPSKGSVGASGDLAPLAHLCLPLIGEGAARYQGRDLSGPEALAVMQLVPLTLAAKEGLALINGTQVSTAVALTYFLQAERLLAAAALIGALSVEAAAGSHVPFDERLQAVRGQSGQIRVAQLMRKWLADSAICASHQACGRVQDPYSLRCQPQVLGACLDNLDHVGRVLIAEANGVSDNPLIFADDASILSGGNFHAEPVAQAADIMAIVLAEIGALSERRTALLMDPHFNGGLPPFLVGNAGMHSGFMLAHVTAAALASANKGLAHPASVDSLPTSANQEDHVSMATNAALRLRDMVENVHGVLSIELLVACQGVECRRPLRASSRLEEMVEGVREKVSFLTEDRVLSGDIEAVGPMVWRVGQWGLADL